MSRVRRRVFYISIAFRTRDLFKCFQPVSTELFGAYDRVCFMMFPYYNLSDSGLGNLRPARLTPH